MNDIAIASAARPAARAFEEAPETLTPIRVDGDQVPSPRVENPQR